MLKVQIPKGKSRDSIELWDVFTGKSNKGREYLIEQSAEGLSLRQGNWKYIPAANFKRTMNTKGKALLFNLNNDPGEKENIINSHPAKAAEMKRILDKAKE